MFILDRKCESCDNDRKKLFYVLTLCPQHGYITLGIVVGSLCSRIPEKDFCVLWRLGEYGAKNGVSILERGCFCFDNR